MYSGLPIYFVEQWEDLTCNNLTTIIKRFLQPGQTFKYEKLTAKYWQEYIAEQVCLEGKVQLDGCRGSFREWHEPCQI
jgi:hypothetical protein